METCALGIVIVHPILVLMDNASPVGIEKKEICVEGSIVKKMDSARLEHV
jgi:hypothetical protein